MENQINLGELDISSITPDNEDVYSKLNGLAKRVYNIELTDLDETSIRDLISIEMSCWINKMNLSATATRRTDIQYTSNAYFCAVEIDCSAIKEIILNQLSKASGTDVINRYVTLKKTFYEILEVKYTSNEHFCRTLLHKSIQRDNLEDTGRFSS